jgi:hypothetical protein
VKRSQVLKSQAVRHLINKALRILVVHEHLGWEGILRGGSHLRRNKVTMKVWNEILNEVTKQRSWISESVKEICAEELKWIEGILL